MSLSPSRILPFRVIVATVALGIMAAYALAAIGSGSLAKASEPNGQSGDPGSVVASDSTSGGEPAEGAPEEAPGEPPTDSPFDGTGQWIWYVSKSGGTAEKIAAKAQRYQVKTVFIKAADGRQYWKQFDRVVQPLKDAGLKVCAWQFVYGRHPRTEARVAARAILKGADCFIVDAEAHFEGGRYRAAYRYMKTLRLKVGPHFPIALSSFPYVDYHPSFPYSAFFKPPYGAQYNLPQVYWRAIGTSVTRAMAHTYLWNDLYGQPISPIAGLWLGERTSELTSFRKLAAQNGSGGVSYWSWQHARWWQWRALSAPLDPEEIGDPLATVYPTLRRGSRGDPVVWLQIQLREWGHWVKRTGYYRRSTERAVMDFQADQDLPATGKMDDATWASILKPPTETARINSSRRNGGAKGSAASNSPQNEFREPESGKLPAKRYEIPRSLRRNLGYKLLDK